MKHLKTAPTQTGFFETYAKLAKSITLSGVFAQIVSGLTEIGGIFAAAYSALLPVFPAFAVYLAGAVALIGTAVLELGLRVLAPHTVDAILYRRYSGLHLPMTIAIWVLTAVLLTASGLLSFYNSQTIVAEFTPEAEKTTTAQADSIYLAATEAATAVWRTDSAQTAAQYAAQITAAQSAGDRQVKAAKRELSNWYNNEKRSGKSYATQKDRARQLIAGREAEAAAKLAALQAAQAAALSEARTRHRQTLEEAKQAHREATSEVKAANDNAEQDRAATVSAYGLGLGWFTVVCLFIFSTAVTLERIHAKGSGIAEKVELSQYDLNPSALAEAWEAFRDRIQYQIRSRIAAFAERTPPPPLPTPAPELYDPTHFANIAVTLKIEREEEGAERVFYIQPKRRAIGFKPSTEADDSTAATHQTGKPGHTKKSGKKAENSCAIKDTSKPTYETPELRALKQRLKDYKKRLGRHEQKAKVQERQKGKVTRRTLDAIENNRHWVEHYTELINQVEAENRKT